MKTIIFTSLALMLVGVGCSSPVIQEEWTGFYYPEGQMSDENDWITAYNYLHKPPALAGVCV